MFERFGKDARRVVVLAQEWARDMRAEQIETGHLLLGVVEDTRVAAMFTELDVDVRALRERVARGTGRDLDEEALASLGIDLDEVRASVEARFGPGALDKAPRRWRGGHIPFHKNAKKTMECALREALQFGDKEILVWHVLLGLLRADPAGVDALVGADGMHERLRAAAAARLNDRAA